MLPNLVLGLPNLALGMLRFVTFGIQLQPPQRLVHKLLLITNFQLLHPRFNSKRNEETPLQQQHERKSTLHQGRDERGKDETVGCVMSQYFFFPSLGRVVLSSPGNHHQVFDPHTHQVFGVPRWRQDLGFPTQVLSHPKSKRKVVPKRKQENRPSLKANGQNR